MNCRRSRGPTVPDDRRVLPQSLGWRGWRGANQRHGEVWRWCRWRCRCLRDLSRPRFPPNYRKKKEEKKQLKRGREVDLMNWGKWRRTWRAERGSTATPGRWDHETARCFGHLDSAIPDAQAVDAVAATSPLRSMLNPFDRQSPQKLRRHSG